MPKVDPQQIPGWPLVDVLLAPDGSVTVDGSPVHVPAGESARTAALARAAGTAARIGRPVRTRLTDTDGAQWLLALRPDGTETVLTAPEQAPKSGKDKRKRPAAKAAVPAEEPAVAEPAASGPTRTKSQLTQAVAAQDWPAALALCAELVREAPPAEGDQSREIQARVTGLTGDHESAYAHFRALTDLRFAAHGPSHPDTVTAAEAAQAQWARLRPDDAVRLSSEVLALRERVPGPDGRGLIGARRHLLRLQVS
ncbi:hypothetical protein ABCR94_03550 [Streptomyces sp. 21So2-11]|uniref:hypothetical protein n=1 Tax=Streptomyces sp. 21So2-11 TaxID=3144408 RepID=UPI0032195BE6